MTTILRQQFIRDFHGQVEWIFGYGSLMWQPEFPYTDSQPATLYGFHRALCLWSVRYRGTPNSPGLVAGLAPGGSCRGVIFRFTANTSEQVLAYLFDRELITGAYRPAVKTCYMEPGRAVPGLVFVSKTDHQQFVKSMSRAQIARIVSSASGPKGSNRDYVQRTVSHLNTLGIRKSELHCIASLLDQAHNQPPLPSKRRS